ncbi:MAG: Trm112 family protein [Candidatus Dadabacteria bacterium]|nr:MAG: Trm112 family protein [Candidatus Dadabacteria bacterium]
MIDKELLDIIVCPETKQDLVPAEPGLIEKINLLIEKGELRNRSKQTVTEKIDGGLIRKEDRKYLYPIRDDIPILLIDESISLEELSNR